MPSCYGVSNPPKGISERLAVSSVWDRLSSAEDTSRICYGPGAKTIPVFTMARLPIVLYPDSVLLRPTVRVEEVDDSLRQLVADMVETMNAAPGIGLAANQVDRAERVCIVDTSAGQEEGLLHVFVNPEILETEGSHIDEEGCLSFPGINIDIERPFRVRVRALDLEGAAFELEVDGLLGRCIQHECEHLDGHTFLRNLSGWKRGIVKRRIRKRIQDGDWVATSAP